MNWRVIFSAQGQRRKRVHAPAQGIMSRLSSIIKEAGIMDVGTITSLITNMGFPIACVIALFWSWSKERESHKDELDKITAALNNNTQALIQIEALLRHDRQA